MSDDDSTTDPAARDRREAVREKAQQVRAQQSRARLVRRSALVTGVLAAGVAVAVVVAWAVSATTGAPQLQPRNLTDDGFAVSSITGVIDGVGSADAAPTDEVSASPESESTPTPVATESAVPVVEIRVYLDYLSPGAREWQLANSQQLSTWVNQGAATLTYHPVSMLAAKSNGTRYSLRAAGAAACMATYSPDDFFTFNNELLTRQPAVDSDGFSDSELADLAIASGADDPKQVRTCIESSSFNAWVREATERAVAGIPDAGDLALTGTPMVIVDGQPYVGALGDPAEFSQFVMTSASGKFYRSQETATPTPSPTPEPTQSATPSPSPTP